MKSLGELPELGRVRRPPIPFRRAVTFAAAVALPVVLAACKDDQGGDSARFCDLVEENVDALRAVPQTAEGIDDYIGLYRDIGEIAPLAIQADWSALTLNFETAWSGEDQQEALARAFATEQSAVAVAAWLKDSCAIDFGPVATIVAQVTTTSTTSTSTPG